VITIWGPYTESYINIMQLNNEHKTHWQLVGEYHYSITNIDTTTWWITFIAEKMEEFENSEIRIKWNKNVIHTFNYESGVTMGLSVACYNNTDAIVKMNEIIKPNIQEFEL